MLSSIHYNDSAPNPIFCPFKDAPIAAVVELHAALLNNEHKHQFHVTRTEFQLCIVAIFQDRGDVLGCMPAGATHALILKPRSRVEKLTAGLFRLFLLLHALGIDSSPLIGVAITALHPRGC